MAKTPKPCATLALRLFLVGVGMSVNMSANAADFFVSTTAELRQALVDASNTTDHVDTIQLADGTYNINDDGQGTFVIVNSGGSATSLVGSSPDAVFLDGDGTGRVILFRGLRRGLGLANLTLQNGFVGVGQNGGGVLVQDGDVSFLNARIRNNVAMGTGGAVRIESPPGNTADFTIHDSVFEGNAAVGGGCAVDLSSGRPGFAFVRIMRSVFREQNCDVAMIRLNPVFDIDIRNTIFEGDPANPNVKAIEIDASRAEILHSTFVNLPTAVATTGLTTVTVINSVFAFSANWDIEGTSDLFVRANNSYLDPNKISAGALIDLENTIRRGHLGFVSMNRSDFRLTKGSILIDRGINNSPFREVVIPSNDITGVSNRPQGPFFDIGPYEARERTHLTTIADFGATNAPEIALMHWDPALQRNFAVVKDALDGQLLSQIDLGDGYGRALGTIPDTDLNGVDEIFLLEERPSDQVRARLKDALTGLQNAAVFFGDRYVPVALEVLPDSNGNGAPEYALLGQSTDSGSIQVRVLDAISGNVIRNLYWGDKTDAVDLAVIPDISGNAQPEFAVVERTLATGRVRAQLKDSVTEASVGKISFSPVLSPFAIEVVADINGNGASELAMGGVRDDTGATQIQLRDTITGAVVKNLFLGMQNFAIDMAVVPDTNANGFPDFVILVELADGSARAKVWDSSTGRFIRNVFFSAVGQPLALAVVDDIDGNGFSEIVVVGNNLGQRRVQIKDSQSGAQLSVIDFP